MANRSNWEACCYILYVKLQQFNGALGFIHIANVDEGRAGAEVGSGQEEANCFPLHLFLWSTVLIHFDLIFKNTVNQKMSFPFLCSFYKCTNWNFVTWKAMYDLYDYENYLYFEFTLFHKEF